jgi:hypothetical protein
MPLGFLGAATASEPIPDTPPPPPSGAELLGPIELDDTIRRRFTEIPVRTETFRPGRSGTAPVRIPVEEGVMFEPRVEEDPSSRMEFKGMFRFDVPR